LLVRTLHGLADVRGRGGAAFWLAECFFSATGGTEMIGARVRVVNEGGSFTTMVYAESLREVEQTAKIRYPGSTVRITFPIEPECFFAGTSYAGARPGLETMEGLTEPIKSS
jgi:hypothetical protein